MRLEHTTITLPLRHAWTLSRGTSREKRNVLVRITSAGRHGVGEAAPNTRYGEDAAGVERDLDRVAAALPGDATGIEIDALLDRVERLLPASPAARAAIDIALHDLAGRLDGTPLHRRFGLDTAAIPPTSFSIGLDTPERMRQKVREARDFALFKVKLGGGDDRAAIEAIRAVTDRPLVVDVNEGWSDPEAAAALIDWLRTMGVIRVEQPLPAADLDGAVRLHRRASLPIIADEAALGEADIAGLADAYDGVNVKLQKAGGLRAARRMIERARQAGLRVMLGCMIETSIGIAAAAHLAALADDADLDGHLLLAADPYRGLRLEGGRVLPSDAPGLGVEGDWPGAIA